MNEKKKFQCQNKKNVFFIKSFASDADVFQQDLTPCYYSKSIKKFFHGKKLTFLECPGNSPDANLIENILNIIKKRARKMDFSIKRKVNKNIIKA